MCSAKQLVEPAKESRGVAGRHLPPEIARGAWDHHHDFDAIGRTSRVEPASANAPLRARRVSATHQHMGPPRPAGHGPLHLPGSSDAGSLSRRREQLLKLKLEPMVAAALVAAASGVVSAPLTAPLGLPERRGLAPDFWLRGDPRRLRSALGPRPALVPIALPQNPDGRPCARRR